MEKSQVYQCPNCGRTYKYGRDDLENRISCDNCRYPLKKIENIKTIRHPELNPMYSDKHVIGHISNNSGVKCPYCKSTNTSKISTSSKVANTVLFGIFGTKRHKQWHCNNCKSDF